MQIAVGGFMGTGKTTLARRLAERLGWSYVPSRRDAVAFLKDLFRDTKRWAFETQVAFLVEKATEARALLDYNRNIIVDRSLSEDVEIFARYFLEKRAIDSRAAAVYAELATYLQTAVGPPAILVFCECSFETSVQRIESRKTPHAKYYPSGHLREIAQLYAEWLTISPYERVAAINTERHDVRSPPVIDAVVADLEAMVLRPGAQRVLFEIPANPTPLAVLTERRWEALVDVPFVAPVRGVHGPPYPSAYIAAPFSGVADDASGDDSLFGPLAPHGIIRRGPYRTFLLGLERALAELGISSLIPHRDVNEWGRRRLSAGEAARLCTAHVKTADVFVAVLGLSAGAHYECGLALGLRKPVVLIKYDMFPESFIGSGIDEALENVCVVRCSNVREVRAALRADHVEEFLRRYVPVRRAGR